jgi:hypothetical protein
MRSREEGAESAGHFTAFYAGGAYNNAPFRVTTLGNVHATTLVTSTTANELKLFAYSDAYTTGYRIGKLYRPSTGSSGLEIGDTDGSGFRISRLDGASNIAYITQMGSANLEIITNSTNRSAIFTSGGALRIGSSLAAGIPAAALTPISTLTLPLNQGVTLGFRYGFLVLIENNTGQSMCCLCVGASIIPIANTDSAFWSYTYGAESRLSIGYTASGIGVFNKYAPAGPNVILNFIFLTFNSY